MRPTNTNKRTRHLIASSLDSFLHIFVLFAALAVLYLFVFSKEREKSSNSAVRASLSSIFNNISATKHCRYKSVVENIRKAFDTTNHVDAVNFLTNDWIRHTTIIGLSLGTIIFVISLVTFRRVISVKHILLFNVLLLGLVGAFEFWFIQTYAMHIKPITKAEFQNHLLSQLRSNEEPTNASLKSALYPAISASTWGILSLLIIIIVVIHAKAEPFGKVRDTFSKLMLSFGAIAVTVTLVFVFVALPLEKRYVKSQIDLTIARLRTKLPKNVQRAISENVPAAKHSSSLSQILPTMLWVHVGVIALIAFGLGMSRERNPSRIFFVIAASVCASFFVEFSFLKFLASRESMFNVVNLEHKFINHFNDALQASCPPNA